MGDHSVAGCTHIEQVPRADRRRGGAARFADVDDASSGDVPLEGPRRFRLDRRPGRLGDRSQVAVEVVHHEDPFRLPMPSDPSRDTTGTAGGSSWADTESASGGGSSRKSVVGVKNMAPVSAVEKSRIRSVLPGGSPTNMLSSMRSVTAGLRE